MKKLYVGNLSYDATENELQALFAEHGTVASTKIIRDRDTNTSKGFAFVEMEDGAAADAAMDALNDAEFMGRNLRVNEARERNDGGGRGRF